MPYHIEILAISADVAKIAKTACTSLNKVQEEFIFQFSEKNSSSHFYFLKTERYHTDKIVSWVEDYKEKVKGNRQFIIVIVDGFLQSDKLANLFGSINKGRDIATFTIHQFQQFVNDGVRFCRYYLTRYALSFLATKISSHDRETDKDCIFHKKIQKNEIQLSLASGKICQDCWEIMEPQLTPDIKDAILKLLLVVSNQHPYSIVMKGGGVKGLAFAGALLELEKFFSFNAFAGASAGAIAAILLGSGYKPSELLSELRSKDFRDFKDASLLKMPINFLFKKGIYPGDDFENWMSDLIKKKISKLNDVTLQDLENHTQTHTIVYASRIKDGTLVFNSKGSRELTHAAFAARCSMSIPYVFIPKLIDGVKVYDGGLRNNFPLKRFVQDNKQNLFIGLYLKSNATKSKFVISELLNMSIDGEEFEIVENNIENVVVIDTWIIGTTEFNLSDLKKDFLVTAGRVAALEFLIKYHPDLDVDRDLYQRLLDEVDNLKRRISPSLR